MENLRGMPLPIEAAGDVNSSAFALLCGLQANILQAHQCPYAFHLFLHFSDGAPARALLKRLVDDGETPITRASDQFQHRQRRKADVTYVAPVLLTVALSCEGYRLMGIDDRLIPADPAFRTGMQLRASAWLGDAPGLSRWEPYFRQRGEDRRFRPEAAIHAMITLAGTDLPMLQGRRIAVDSLLAASGVRTVGSEFGQQLYNADGRPIEHFGFVDSVSNPIFLDDRARRGQAWDAAAPLGVVLERCPGGAEVDHGSYVAFRKLEQNVRQFADMRQALASSLGTSEEVAAALVVGRSQDGSPLVSRMQGSTGDNDFDYRDDMSGVRCPYAAHVRKMNPRGSSSGRPGERVQMVQSEQRHLIARRGITYGTRSEQRDGGGAPADRPEGGVGLLFVCYQSSITDQFEHLQRVWANATTFPPVGLPHAGRDLLIGAGDEPFAARFADLGANLVRRVIPTCVVPKGGEYFFAPSVAFFERL